MKMKYDDKAGDPSRSVVSLCVPIHSKPKKIYADVVSQLPRKDRGPMPDVVCLCACHRIHTGK